MERGVEKGVGGQDTGSVLVKKLHRDPTVEEGGRVGNVHKKVKDPHQHRHGGRV